MEYKVFLSNRIKEIQSQIGKFPRGKFSCICDKGHYKWRCLCDGKIIYIKKNNEDFAKKLAIKTYLSFLLEDLKCELAHAKSTLPESKARKFLNSSPEIRRLLAGNYFDWTTLSENTSFSESRNVPAIDGYYVRSKSEASIFAALYNSGLAFRYECKIVIDGVDYFPDFAIKNFITGEIIIWEHFGMMDNPEYRRKALWKLQAYERAGYHLGSNLIITTEVPGRPMTYQKAMQVIDEYFMIL